MDLKNRENHIPWIVFEAREWLENFLNRDMNVFEWGSGGSTLYFCKRVKKVVSIEHDQKWYSKVKDVLSGEKLFNCDYFLIEPVKFSPIKFLPYRSAFYNSKTFSEYLDCSFRNYVKKIEAYPDNFFNLIFIDGRSRASCLKKALNKVKKGGFIMLDNSERELYQNEMNKLKNFQRQDFFGHGPYIAEKWQTTIWRID